MSVSFVERCPDLVIPNGVADSNIINAREHYGDAVAISVQSPGTLDAVTYSFQVSTDGTTFVTAQIGATLADITVPATGKGAVYLSELLTWPYLKIHASGNSAAARTFKVNKHYTTTGL